MNLHRTKGRPDWVEIAKHRYNRWQHIAVWTKGIVTPGNLVTIAGFGLVVYGLIEVLRQHYWMGIAFIAIGRLLDVVDGWLADKTGTKSPLGELLDAALDKVSTVLTLAVLWVTGIAPWWVLIALLVPHLLITIISAVAVRRKQPIHPSRIGKNSMATAGVSLVGFIVAEAVGAYGFHPFALVMYGIAIVSVWLGVFAMFGYLDQMKKR